MTYKLTVSNSQQYALTASDGTIIGSGGEHAFSGGDISIEAPGFGFAVFQDIGERHIDHGDPKKLGVLVTYRDRQVVARYKDHGEQLQASFQGYNQLKLTGMSIHQVQLSPITVD